MNSYDRFRSKSYQIVESHDHYNQAMKSQRPESLIISRSRGQYRLATLVCIVVEAVVLSLGENQIFSVIGKSTPSEIRSWRN